MRPQDLPAALKAWALANYAAGPAWGGTAQRQAPAGSALVPGTSLPAMVLNYLVGYAFDVAQGALNMDGQLPALNWNGPVALPSTMSPTVGPVWDDTDQAWLLINPTSGGSTNTAYRSLDFGKTWSSTALASTTSNIYDVAFGGGGTTAVAAGGTNVQVGNAGGSSWANYTGVIATAFTTSSIAYDATTGLYCIAGATSSGAKSAYTASNPASTWTAQTLPSTWSSSTSGAGVTIGAGGGMMVAAFQDTTGTFRTIRSVNGGVTWTNDQSLTAGISSYTTLGRPVWSATDSRWYIFLSRASAGTQVFSSPDGITWTSVALLTLNTPWTVFVSMACLGSLLVGLEAGGRILVSFNQGASWFKTGNLGGTNSFQRIAAGGNGFLAATQITAAASQRFGLPVTPV